MSRHVVRKSVVIISAVIASCLFVLLPTPADPQPGARFVRAQYPVAGRYVVVLRPEAVARDRGGVRGIANAMVRGNHGAILHVYEHALLGFAARLPAELAEALSEDPRVDWVQEDSAVATSGVQTPAAWNLDRIDVQTRSYDNSYNYVLSGTGVNVYVIDTGIRTSHVEFEGRALGGALGFSAYSDGKGTSDTDGHGTHVAAIIGGVTRGVAKKVTLYAVRAHDEVLGPGCADQIAAVDWVKAHHRKPAVVNMSIRCIGGDGALDAAVFQAIDAGITLWLPLGTTAPTHVCNLPRASVPQSRWPRRTISTSRGPAATREAASISSLLG